VRAFLGHVGGRGATVENFSDDYPLERWSAGFGTPGPAERDDSSPHESAASIVYSDATLDLSDFLSGTLLAAFEPDLGGQMGSPLAGGMRRAWRRYAPIAEQVNGSIGKFKSDLTGESPESAACRTANTELGVLKLMAAIEDSIVGGGFNLLTDEQRELLAAYDIVVPDWIVVNDRPYTPIVSRHTGTNVWHKFASTASVDVALGDRVSPASYPFPLNWYVVGYPAEIVGLYCPAVSTTLQAASRGDPIPLELMLDLPPPWVSLPRKSQPDDDGTGTSKERLLEFADSLYAAADNVRSDGISSFIDVLSAVAQLIADRFLEWAVNGADDGTDDDTTWDAVRDEIGPPIRFLFGAPVALYMLRWVGLPLLRFLVVVIAAWNLSGKDEELGDSMEQWADRIRRGASDGAVVNDTVGWFLLGTAGLVDDLKEILGAVDVLDDFLDGLAPFEMTWQEIRALSLGLITNPPTGAQARSIVGRTDVALYDNAEAEGVPRWGEESALRSVFPSTGSGILGEELEDSAFNWSGITPVYFVRWPDQIGFFRYGYYPGAWIAQFQPNAQEWLADFGPFIQVVDAIERGRSLLGAGLVSNSLFFATAQLASGNGRIATNLEDGFLEELGWNCLNEVLSGRSLADFYAAVWRVLMHEGLVGYMCGQLVYPSDEESDDVASGRAGAGGSGLVLSSEAQEALDYVLSELLAQDDISADAATLADCLRDAQAALGPGVGPPLPGGAVVGKLPGSPADQADATSCVCLMELLCWAIPNNRWDDYRAGYLLVGEVNTQRWALSSILDRVLGPVEPDFDWESWKYSSSPWLRPGWRDWSQGILAKMASKTSLCDGWSALSCDEQEVFHDFAAAVSRHCFVDDLIDALRVED